MNNESIYKTLQKKLSIQFCKGVKYFNLIQPGDSILAGLSGGKDSLALIELLGLYRKKNNYNFSITALHVKMRNISYSSNTEYLKEFCKHYDINLIIKETQFEKDKQKNRTPCFLCSWNRRKILFETAQEIGANKIALGHHQDDIIHTLLMNLNYQGSFTTMPVKIKMKKFPISIIRPLCKIQEIDISTWSELNHYRPMIKICPYDKNSKRATIRTLFSTIEEENKEARYNIWHALEKEGKLIEE